LAAALLWGCGVEVTDPPIEVHSRDSLIGAGRIIQVSNTSNQALSKIEVQIESPAGEERRFTHDTLEGFETLEIGWKRLGGWEIPTGADVTVRCEGYLGSVTATVTASAANDSSP